MDEDLYEYDPGAAYPHPSRRVAHLSPEEREIPRPSEQDKPDWTREFNSTPVLPAIPRNSTTRQQDMSRDFYDTATQTDILPRFRTLSPILENEANTENEDSDTDEDYDDSMAEMYELMNTEWDQMKTAHDQTKDIMKKAFYQYVELKEHYLDWNKTKSVSRTPELTASEKTCIEEVRDTPQCRREIATRKAASFTDHGIQEQERRISHNGTKSEKVMSSAFQLRAANSFPFLPRPPSVPQLPSVPRPPSIPRLPSVSRLPSVPRQTLVPRPPSVPRLPPVSQLPSVPRPPSIPRLPSVSRLPSVPQPSVPRPPSIPRLSSVSRLPSVPRQPSVPRPPSVPRLPPVSRLPSVSLLPSVPILPPIPRPPSVRRHGSALARGEKEPKRLRAVKPSRSPVTNNQQSGFDANEDSPRSD